MGLLTLATMASRVQGRFNIGKPAATLVTMLNELYVQNTALPLKWNLVVEDVDFTDVSGEITGDLPTTSGAAFDPGMPAYLSGDPDRGYGVEIPYRPYEVALRNQTYVGSVVEGQYSFWTFRMGSSGYEAVLYPAAAGPPSGDHTLKLVYHRLQTAEASSSDYFPWPHRFDYFLMDLLEAELKRIHQGVGWEQALAKAQQQLQNMLDKYVTTKQAMAGLALETRKAQEVQAETRLR